MPVDSREDELDVIDKAHVKHPVGFIKHNVLYGVQTYGASLHVVDKPSRRGHHDMGAPPELVVLEAKALPTVDRDGRYLDIL